MTLSDEAIDLSKARRIEAHAPLPHLPLGRSPQAAKVGLGGCRGRIENLLIPEAVLISRTPPGRGSCDELLEDAPKVRLPRDLRRRESWAH